MNGRIDTALHAHLGGTEIDSVEAMNTVMEFVGRNTEMVDGIRGKAQIDIEDEEVARMFVRERVSVGVHRRGDALLAIFLCRLQSF